MPPPTKEDDTSRRASSANSTMSSNEARWSIEELFYSESSVQSEDLCARRMMHEQLKLTPRSEEVCKINGVIPDFLQKRPMASFMGKKVDEDHAMLCERAYIDRQERLYRLCQKSRNAMIAKEERRKRRGKSNGPKIELNIKDESTAVRQAKQQMATLKQRQEKEVQSMLDFGVKMREIQEDAAKHKQAEELRSQQAQAEKRKRLRNAAEVKRQKAQIKLEEEEAEAERQAERAYQEFLEQQEKERRRIQMQKQMQRDTIAREQHQREQLAKFREQTEKILAEQQQATLQQMAIMEEKERARLKREKEARKLRADEMAARRAVVEKRIAANLQQARSIEEKKREDFEEKQEEIRVRQMKMAAAAAEEQGLTNKLSALIEKKRQMTLQDMYRKEEKKAGMIIDKRMRSEAALERQMELKRRQNELKGQGRHLSLQMRTDEVERRQRITAEEVAASAAKMRDNDLRIAKMVEDRANIRRLQMDVSTKMNLQRQAINEAMEQCKVDKNWGKAQKKIDSIMHPEEDGSGAKKSSTVKRKIKKKKQPVHKKKGSWFAGTRRTSFLSKAGSLLLDQQADPALFAHMQRKLSKLPEYPGFSTQQRREPMGGKTAAAEVIAAELARENPFAAEVRPFTPSFEIPPSGITYSRKGPKKFSPSHRGPAKHAAYASY